MKRWMIVLPTLFATSGLPLVSLVGCGDEPQPVVHEVNIDPSSDFNEINISTPEITLNQQLIIEYEVINPDKQLMLNSCWISFDTDKHFITDYDYSNNKITIPDDQVTTYDITICLKSEDIPSPPPVEHHFSSDSWAYVNYYASQGINTLHTIYKEDCDNNTIVPNTLIGLTRTVDINGKAHIVRVLGEEQDTDQNGSKVALTFQFDNLISDDQGRFLTIKREKEWGTENSDYWASNLENALNGEEPVEWRILNGEEVVPAEQQINVCEMIEKGQDSTLLNHIKPVNRTVNTYKSGVWSRTNKVVKLFLPTLSNIYSSKGMSDESSFEYIRDHINEMIAEGQKDIKDKQYTYFKSVAGDIPANSDPHEFLIHESCSPITRSYSWWLSTPVTEAHSVMSYSVSDFGRLDWCVPTFSFSVSPCFCI